LEDKVAKQKRFRTNYPGVFYVEGKALGRTGTEKIYYIRYRRDGKLIEEKAVRQFTDDMTPARAAGIRVQRAEGKQQSNTQQRDEVKSKFAIDSLAKEHFSLRKKASLLTLTRDDIKIICKSLLAKKNLKNLSNLTPTGLKSIS
jgi:hypothetical protein